MRIPVPHTMWKTEEKKIDEGKKKCVCVCVCVGGGGGIHFISIHRVDGPFS